MDDDQPLIYPGPRTALMRRLASLSVDDLRTLATAIETLVKEKPFRGRVDRGFWFAWNDGLRLDGREQAEIQELFSDVMVAIASGLTGLDINRFGARLGTGGRGRDSGPLGGMLGLFRQRSDAQRRQETAVGLIVDAAAPWDPRLGMMACWNVACAAALRRRVRPATSDALEAAWRAAFGEPPA